MCLHEGERQGGRIREYFYTSVYTHIYPNSDFYPCVRLAGVYMCARACVSRQQRSEAEADVMPLTLGLDVFTAV